ncbi:ParB-like nuclease [Hoeflea sp. IMCC20628]|uniref:ParB/RepB/Spo0J family partition protein n=1 Tax=Hoeflea sp. IMCC20628 TaxID=1620421 RepID=UPI00063ACDE7|nr:ParB/RepB/Spo0J family partition protein [Hoeflea sp. IMCC20628]AKI02267.1 ParB-like nuclease [Hoeflea sp. IMCC20628]
MRRGYRPTAVGKGTVTPERLLELEQLRQGTSISDLRSRSLTLDQIRTMPEVFQPRMSVPSEKHVSDLRSSLKSVRDLTPVLVLPLGEHAVVIDGHHRLEAYRMEDRDEIPVEFFGGTVQEAILQSGAENSKTVMPLNLSQRTNWAWKLVRMVKPGDAMGYLFSKRQITVSAAVSSGTVAAMRLAAKALGEDADEYPSWDLARQAWQDQETPEAYQPYGEEELEEQAQLIADRIARSIGTHRANNPEIMARGLTKFLGRNTPDVISEMIVRCEEDPALAHIVEQIRERHGWEDEDADY